MVESKRVVKPNTSEQLELLPKTCLKGAVEETRHFQSKMLIRRAKTLMFVIMLSPHNQEPLVSKMLQYTRFVPKEAKCLRKS